MFGDGNVTAQQRRNARQKASVMKVDLSKWSLSKAMSAACARGDHEDCDVKGCSCPHHDKM
jgi:hypothetical protein